ncbi:MAG: hypothetical protein AB8G05_19680 [Oligoflexales bacterium]
MPKIEQEISSQAKKIYNKLKKEHGDEFVLENILNEYKEFENAVSENEKLSTRLEKSKEKISELKKLVEESRSTIKETPSMSNPDIITALNETITTIKSLNESYARENERLLKIVNFSEYDDKVNSLKAEIAAHSKTILQLKDHLKSSKESCVNFEIQSLKLEEEKLELTTDLESKKTEISELLNKVAKYDGEKAQLESTVTSYVEELRRYKAMIEEMKAQVPVQPDQTETDATTYS